jgi:choline dehydrogenase-like flavoprotein
LTDYDVIIIGSGAGGSTVARSLADTGKKILILERGDFLPREKKNWDPDFIFGERGYQVEEDWYDHEKKETFKPQAFYKVGGNTKVYGSVLMRMRAEDFGEQTWPDGKSPAWALDYSEYEPYYTRAEDWYCIHGKLGEDPTEPFHSGEDFPFPPMEHEPRIQEAADELEAQGLIPIHSTLSLNRDPKNPEKRPCIRCSTCDPYPCMLHAKQDAETAGIRPALRHDNVELWTNAHVEKLTSTGSKMDTVHVTVEGKSYELKADIVVVSCGAVNSAALLLRSEMKDESGLLGRNLMKHNHSGIHAISNRPNPTVFQKTLGFHDYYFKGPKAHQNYGLGTIQLTGKAPWQRLKGFVGADMSDDHYKFLEKHAIDWWATTDDLPDPNNRVRLQKNGKPALDFRPNNRQPHDELIEAWTTHLRATGDYMFMIKTMGIETLWHQAGTAVFGENAATSVLDINCRAHAYDNLYVVDSSFMPGMGAVNLTLTIIANALRVSDRIREGMGYKVNVDASTRPGQMVPPEGTSVSYA